MSTKTEISKIAILFCKMHIFVNMATQVDYCLQSILFLINSNVTLMEAFKTQVLFSAVVT
jgi:hypothetical protein